MMLEGFIAGAVTALVSAIAGYLMGKPYLDRWQQLRLAAKKAQAPGQKPGGTQP